MTEPLTVTEIDAATKDELQPPCQAISNWTGEPSCFTPAVWVVTAVHSCGPRVLLVCHWHLGRVYRSESGCRKCLGPEPWAVSSVDPLR